MVDVYINQGQVDRNAVYDGTRRNPNVITDIVTNADATNDLVKSLDDFVTKERGKMDKETVRKAQEAGAMAGMMGGFKPIDAADPVAEAYNRAGSEIYLNKKIADVSLQMNKTAMNPSLQNNPAAMQRALEDLKTELSKDVPFTLLPDFDVAFGDRMSRQIQVAQQKEYDLRISANAAQFAETEAALFAEATNAARGGDEGTLAQAREEYFSSINRQVGLSMMPEAAAKKKILFDQQVRKDSVIGDFLRTPPEERATFAETFITENPLSDILPAEEIDDLKQQMIGAWNVDENFIEAAKAETNSIQEEAKNNALSNFHLAPTTENFTAFVKMEGVTPEEIKGARSYLESNIEKSDPVMVGYIEDLYYKGDYSAMNEVMNDPSNAGLLKRGDVQKYRKLVAESQSGGGFEATEAWQETNRRIREDYKSNSMLGDSMNEEGSAIRQAIYDELRVNYPKYLAGELKYADVDPLRMYRLKKSNLDSLSEKSVGGGKQISTSSGVKVIPQKYIDNPDSFDYDRKNGLGDKNLFESTEVMDFMIQLKIAQEKAKLEENK